MKRLLLLIGAFCATVPLLGGGVIKVTKVDFVVIRQDQDRSGVASQDVLTKTLYIASDGRELTDTDDQRLGLHTTEIYNPSTLVTSFLDMKKKTFFTMQEGSFPGQKGKGKDLGRKKMQGLDCYGFANMTTAGSLEHWWCTDPSSGAKFLGGLTFHTPDGRQWGETIQKVTPGVSVPDNFFDVPNSFQSVNVEAPGQVR